MNVRRFPLFSGRKAPLPQPLRWVITRSRRLERFFSCSRRDAIRAAIADYAAFMGHRPPAPPASSLKGRRHA